MDLNLQLPLKGETLAERAYAVLKDAIFTGKIKPGDSIRELHAAKMMSVSQATVREALVQLERVGLVIRQTNRRTIVTSFTREEVKERLEVRLLLEQHAVALACARMTDEEMQQLDARAEELERTIEAQDHFENVVADKRFHAFLWEHSGNSVLCRTLDELTTPLFAFLSIMHRMGMMDLRRTRPHSLIVAAVRSRSADRAQEAVRDHITGAYARFLETGAGNLGEMIAGQGQ